MVDENGPKPTWAEVAKRKKHAKKNDKPTPQKTGSLFKYVSTLHMMDMPEDARITTTPKPRLLKRGFQNGLVCELSAFVQNWKEVATEVAGSLKNAKAVVFDNKKRLMYVSFQEDTDISEIIQEGRTIGNIQIPMTRLYKAHGDIATVNISRIWPTNAVSTTRAIYEGFSKFGKVVDIQLELFGKTNLLTEYARVSIDIGNHTNGLKGMKIPHTMEILGDEVLLNWAGAPKMCYYCKKEGHKKKQCPTLIKRNKIGNKTNEERRKLQRTKKPIHTSESEVQAITLPEPTKKPGRKPESEVQANALREPTKKLEGKPESEVETNTLPVPTKQSTEIHTRQEEKRSDLGNNQPSISVEPPEKSEEITMENMYTNSTNPEAKRIEHDSVPIEPPDQQTIGLFTCEPWDQSRLRIRAVKVSTATKIQ